MLQSGKSPGIPAAGKVASPTSSPAELYVALSAFVRRQYPIIAFVWLLVVALGAVYLFTTPPHYTANAKLIIDSHKMQLFAAQSVLGDISVDSANVESQVEILKSDNIALSVIRELHLNEDPEFVAPGAGILGTAFGLVTSLFTQSVPKSDFQNLRRAVAVFERNLSIKRVNLTLVIDIAFSSLRPERAAQIANAVADAYIVDQLEAKYQATRRASKWLQDRIRELRDQASIAEREVIDFKEKNNIVDTGGRLIGEQRLVEINSQLVAEQAQRAEAEARLQRIQAITSNGAPETAIAGLMEKGDAAVADTLHNEVIVKLRSQYLEYAAREADWTRRMGPTHLAVINVRNQMLEVRKAIFDELSRIAETYKSDLEIAKAREESLKKTLADTVAQSQATDKSGIALRELESSAQTYRALYDNFLQRYMEATQQESFPITEARLISEASAPLEKSQPKTALVLLLTSSAGLLLAFGAGLMRETRDRVFRSGAQVETLLHTDCIAVLPMVKNAKALPTGRKRATLPPQQAGARLLTNDQTMLWYVVNHPFSRFAEAVRAVKVAADVFGVSRSNKVIGVTSAVPNEGKSTLATSLAQIMAHGGARVILVDADLRNPMLSRQMTPGATLGLIELITGNAELNDVIWREPASNLTFLPTVMETRLAHTSEILSSTATNQLVASLREAYDYVVLDLSPLAPVVDVRATTGLVDSYVFVVEWGRTKIDVVEHTLDAARGVYDNLLGAVLSKADFDVLKRYDGYRGNYYYRRYYARYGYTD
jgi:polysaccharide biosynthesis transport protein